jgi:GxxExxY protein
MTRITGKRYEACLKYELEKRGLKVLSQVGLPVTYDGMKINLGYRLDLLVEYSVIVELKAVNQITPVHEAGAAFLPQTKRKTLWTAN